MNLQFSNHEVELTLLTIIQFGVCIAAGSERTTKKRKKKKKKKKKKTYIITSFQVSDETSPATIAVHGVYTQISTDEAIIFRTLVNSFSHTLVNSFS